MDLEILGLFRFAAFKVLGSASLSPKTVKPVVVQAFQDLRSCRGLSTSCGSHYSMIFTAIFVIPAREADLDPKSM